MFLCYKNGVSRKIAYIISRIFGPLPLLCLLWLVTAFKSGIGFWRALWVYPLIFLATIAIPNLITIFLITTKRVKGLDWPDLTERKKYLPTITLISILGLTMLTKLLTNETIFHLSLLLSLIGFLVILIWLFFNFKISAHIVVATGTFAGLNLFFHMQYLWLFLLLIPIIWARHELKMHTYFQLIAGFIMPTIVTLLAILIFGWPKVP